MPVNMATLKDVTQQITNRFKLNIGAKKLRVYSDVKSAYAAVRIHVFIIH
jgi:hypothetical protein